MDIGILNEAIGRSLVTVRYADRTDAPAMEKSGNPLCGEPLSVSWKALFDGAVDISAAFENEIYLDTLVLTLGDDSSPLAVTLYNRDKSVKLDAVSGEAGQRIQGKTLRLRADETLNGFLLEIETSFSPITITSMALYGAVGADDGLYPVPKRMTQTGERVSAAVFSTVSAETEPASKAVSVLKEKFAEETGIVLSESADGAVRFAEDASVPQNGYRLSVAPGCAVITASDCRGFVIGAESFLKLLRDGSFPVCEVEDAPMASFRGVHIYLPAEDQFAFAKRLIKYLISPVGYNYVILEFAGGMRFDSHPEISEAFANANRKAKAGEWPPFPHGGVAGGCPVEKEQVRDFVVYIRRFGIEVIPEIQSLSHVQFMTAAHPEIAERPEDAPVYSETDARLADVPPSDFYPHSFCPSNPKSYEILFDLADEIIDVVQPTEYVHMGHDEVYQIGICPRCKKRDPAELYAEDVNKIHDYLAKRGLKMMIWSDMLQPCSAYKTPPAIHRIPKDIVFMDFIWYFHPAKDIEDNLLPEGFSLIYGNMYSSHFPRYESRIRKPGVIGGQLSAWVSTSEEALGREGKLYDFLYTAGMLWTESYVSDARYAYDRLLRARIPALREKLSGVSAPSLAAGHTEECFLSRDVTSPLSVPTGLLLKLDAYADSLVFEHAARAHRKRVPWVKLDALGAYVVTYEDGTEERIPVLYGGNIAVWSRKQNQPFTDMYYRHNGYCASYFCDSTETRAQDGRRVTFFRYEWKNPTPEKKLRAVRYETAQQPDILVKSVIGIRCK